MAMQPEQKQASPCVVPVGMHPITRHIARTECSDSCALISAYPTRTAWQSMQRCPHAIAHTQRGIDAVTHFVQRRPFYVLSVAGLSATLLPAPRGSGTSPGPSTPIRQRPFVSDA